MRLHDFFRRDDHRRRAIVDSGGITCGHGSRIAKWSLELRQLFECRLGAGMLVLVDLDRTAFAARHFDCNDLFSEKSGSDGLAGSLLRAQRKSVLVRSRDLEFLGDVLSGLRHRVRCHIAASSTD